MNDFEQHLRRRPLEGVPAEWRAEILKSARAGEIVAPRVNVSERRWAPLLATVRAWLWPHPGAWASLAALWLLLFVMQHQMNVEIQEELVLAGIQPPVTDVMVAMEQHQIAIKQLLALNDFELPVIDRPKRVPVAPTNLPPLMLFTT